MANTEKQEPVAWITTWNEPNDKGVELHWAKQDKGASSKHTPLFYNQHKPENCEPYAWAYKTNNTWEHISFVEPPDDAYDEGSLVVLYTAPPPREWQGLTDEEIEDCMEMSIQRTCRAIEAKLKEKNNG